MLRKTSLATVSLIGIYLVTFGQPGAGDIALAERNIKVPSAGVEEEWPLEKVFRQLENVRKISFAYQKKYIEDKYVIYKPLGNDNIEAYLSELLQPLGLAFKKIDRVEETIFVIYLVEDSGESEPVSETGKQEFETDDTPQKITGYVEGVDAGPLAGVNIVFTSSGKGTVTDGSGRFFLEMPKNGTESLVVSFVGYETREIKVTNGGEIAVLLRENTQPMNEVVVTALGIGREQRTLGYGVARLQVEPLTTTGNTNFASVLYGRAPGVRVRTAPGGATSAVTVQIRGLSSLNYNTQPLYVVNGVIMRDGNEKGAKGLNNTDYFTEERIRGNGILDIPMSDIESINILKGASATALYGSDAANGVVVITTKKGEASNGVGVSFDYHYSIEEAAFLPRFQNIYGPGYDRNRNAALGATAEGWIAVGDNRNVYRPMFESYAQFGPEMKGQEVLWWDGNPREYKARPNNYKNFYRKGANSLYHLAFGDVTGRARYRISYSRNDYKGIQQGGSLERNSLHLNSQVSLNKWISAGISVLYSNSFVHNRPLKINRLTSSWNGFFSRAEDMALFLDKYKTSEGYKWVPYDRAELNASEALKYVTPRGYEVMDFLWKQLRNSENEYQDRWISGAHLNFQFTDHLSLATRIGSDFTSALIEKKEYNEYHTKFNGAKSTGSYSTSSGRYTVFYSDALINYSRPVSHHWQLSLTGGVQTREENFADHTVDTSGGLTVENRFNLSNSFDPELTTTSGTSQTLRYAFLGIANIGFRDFLFVEGTGRKEYSSTLPSASGGYFYPSVNSSFIFSEVFPLPAIFDYAKLRASYGIVGNAPPAYEANLSYVSNNLYTPQGVVTGISPSSDPYGNENIRPERKHELELGLESLFFNKKLALELTYYNNRIDDQLVKLNLPSSTGGKRILTNAGQLHSSGWEVGIFSRPVSQGLTWQTGVNLAYNLTRVQKLSNGVEQLVFREFEGNSIKVVAERGQAVGDIYVYPQMTDTQGNFIVNQNGLYVMDKSRYIKAGNILPKFTGGVTNNFSLRNFELDFLIDYSMGGEIISPSMKYGTASGMYESTLRYRDEEGGGLPYYINEGGQKELLGSHKDKAPDGSQVYHDGVLLKGVTEEGVVNSTIIDAATYYINTFDWGNNAWNETSAIYRNSYVKLREASFSYHLPEELARRIHFQSIKLSVVGRNLFYIWRTLKNADPETTIGTHWLNQGIDEGSMAASRSYGFTINMTF